MLVGITLQNVSQWIIFGQNYRALKFFARPCREIIQRKYETFKIWCEIHKVTPIEDRQICLIFGRVESLHTNLYSLVQIWNKHHCWLTTVFYQSKIPLHSIHGQQTGQIWDKVLACRWCGIKLSNKWCSIFGKGWIATGWWRFVRWSTAHWSIRGQM